LYIAFPILENNFAYVSNHLLPYRRKDWLYAYQRKDYRMLGVDFRATASWNHLFAEKHITNLFAGMEVNDISP